MRIHITGNAGAGKTTLSRELALQYQLPLKHLDSVVWATNWEKPKPEERDKAVRFMCEGEAWIIDGVSEAVRERADYIIFLDTPRSTCLYRCIKRCFQSGLNASQHQAYAMDVFQHPVLPACSGCGGGLRQINSSRHSCGQSDRSASRNK